MKNKDFRALAHLFAKVCLNPSNAEGSKAFELDKGNDQWVQFNPQGTWSIYVGKLIGKQV